MTALGVDYSQHPPNPRTLWDRGYRLAGRYLSPPPNAKNLTRDEAAALLAAGLDVITVWESTADRALAGAGAGLADGRLAKKMADAMGAPAGAAIYYAVDFDTKQFGAIVAYQQAFAAGISPHPVGVYGSYAVVEAMVHAGAVFTWQTAAWSHGKISGFADVYQRVQQIVVDGTVCDVDEVRGQVGGWKTPTPSGPTPLPIPPNIATQDEENSVLVAVQLPALRPEEDQGSGYWDCDGNPGVVGDPFNPPRPLIRWEDYRGVGVNGDDNAIDEGDRGIVRANDHGLPNGGPQIVRLSWGGFPKGARPLVWVQTVP